MTFPGLHLHCLPLAFPKFNAFFFTSSKEQSATKHWVTFSSCCFSVVQKKIWKVLHILGKIPKFPLPRNANAKKMLRWLQTICTSALFVTGVLSFVWGFHCCLLGMRKGTPAEEPGMNKKHIKHYPRMRRVIRWTNKLLLSSVLVPSPSQYFRYCLYQYLHLPEFLTETLGPRNTTFFTVPLVKTIKRATKAHLRIRRES